MAAPPTPEARTRPFRLVQLSDSHLPAKPETAYRGVAADAGFDAVVSAAARWKPDALLLTGDVSEDASEASYRRARATLSRVACPVYALPGNHDQAAAMRAYFERGPWTGPAVARLGAWFLVLLDSTLDRRVEGRIADAALSWLADWLESRPLPEREAPVLIALHHQPVEVGSRWIDRYRLQNPAALLRLVAANGCVRGLVWGHVHQDYSDRLGAATLLACPSTAVNSLARVERFTPDAAGPAGRWLELGQDGSLRTGLIRPAGLELNGAGVPARG